MNIGFLKFGLKTYFEKDGTGQGSNHELVDVFNIFKERGHNCQMLSFNDKYDVVSTEGLDWIFAFNGFLPNTLETQMNMLKQPIEMFKLLNSCSVPYAYFWTDKRYDIRDIEVVRQPAVILSQEKENYAHLDKLILYNKKIREVEDKDIEFAILMNNTEPKRSKKLLTFVNWLKDFQDVKVIGDWKKQEDKSIFTGSIAESEVDNYLSRVKFSFNIATNVFWTSQKYYEMLLNNVVCFYHHYDMDNIIMKDDDFRRVYDEINLDDKLTLIKKDIDLYNTILKNQRLELKPEFFDGSLVYNTIMDKIGGIGMSKSIKKLIINEKSMGEISFEKLSTLVASLEEYKAGIDEKKYKAYRDAREVLQQIKLEAQALRQSINELRKA